MRFRLSLAVLVGSLLALGCDGGGGGDAGVDAALPDAGPTDAGSMDAGTDAGAVDAGTDAGAMDAGPPLPIDTAMDVQTELERAVEIADAIPPDIEMTIEAPLLDVNVASSGIDAVIGEKGISTLSLSAGAVRAFADVRQCNVLLAILDRALLGLSDAIAPEVVALRDQVGILRDRLAAHRDAVARLFVERRDVGIPGEAVILEPFTETQYAFGTGFPARLAFAAESISPSPEEAFLRVSCGSFAPSGDVRVVDLTSGVELASGALVEGGISLPVPLPYEETSIIEVQVEGIIRDPMLYISCPVDLDTRRRVRVSPIDTAGNSALAAAQTSFFSAQDQIGFEIANTTALPSAVVESVDAHVGVMSDLVARLVVEGAVIPVETLERIEREVIYVRAMTDRLSLELSSVSGAAALASALGDLESAVDALIANVMTTA